MAPPNRLYAVARESDVKPSRGLSTNYEKIGHQGGAINAQCAANLIHILLRSDHILEIHGTRARVVDLLMLHFIIAFLLILCL